MADKNVRPDGDPDVQSPEARKPYVPPAIEAEDDLSAEELLHFAPTGFGQDVECGYSGCGG